MIITFLITGGVFFINNRSTSISIECTNIKEGYDKAAFWSKKHFPDWNHIGTLNKGRALIENVNVSLPLPRFISRRTTQRKTI